jgi:transcriptional regulator with XRE-family HTH domain
MYIFGDFVVRLYYAMYNTSIREGDRMPTLRYLRLSANLTKRQLAEMAGIDYKTLLRADRGMPIMERNLVKLLKALNEHLGTQYTLADIVEDDKG